MAALRRALDAVQETMMELYEKDSHALKDHILLWTLQRREAVLLCAARQKGYLRVSGQVVPPAHISECKAKQAITLQLLLQSLETSAFNDCKWTLTDTSWERYMAPPKQMLKQGPFVVEVMFDGEAENSMWYTGWTCIYNYMDGQWHCHKSDCDETGLFYVDALGHRCMYVDFSEEAKKYGTTGLWQVKYQSMVFSSVHVTSTSSSTPAAASTSTTGTETAVSRKHSLDRGSFTEPDSPTPKRYHLQQRGRPGRKARLLAKPLGSRILQPATATTRLSQTLSSDPLSPKASSPVPPALYLPGETFDEPSSGSCPELTEHVGCPMILLKGAANQLKCLRYRWKKLYSKYFVSASTTWAWAGQGGAERVGKSRMLVMFADSAKRDIFCSVASVPPGVEIVKCQMA